MHERGGACTETKEADNSGILYRRLQEHGRMGYRTPLMPFLLRHDETSPASPASASGAYTDWTEYVCVKVDKRLAELIRKKQRQRAARAAALEKKVARDGGLRNSKGEFVNVSLQPTLPKIQLEEDDMSVKGLRGMGRSGSTDALGAFGMFNLRPCFFSRDSSTTEK